MSQYSSYQLKALQQLADFRCIFYDESKNVKTDSLQKSINSFVELFCQHHFANSDYTTIQKRPSHVSSVDQWIEQFDVETVLKGLTYYIWTNKSNDGYFIRKIKDKTIYKHLARLNDLLSENRKQSKLKTTG